MTQVSVKTNNVLKAFRNADEKGKQLLKDLFEDDFFNMKITDRVKTFEDACSILGLNPSKVYHDGDSKDDIAYKKLKVITKALNEGWEPDWSNSNELKYYAWQKWSGSGFSGSNYDYSSTDTDVGSRLCFKSSDLALYAGKQFESIYNDYLTI